MSATGSHDFSEYLKSMPVIPELAAQVLKMTEDGGASFAGLEGIIGRDPSLTARVLKVANSALYSRPRGVTTVSAAVSLLGFHTIRSLVILVAGASLFEKDRHRPFFRSFWRQSLSTAFHAKALAFHTGHSEVAEEAFTAGLLHNLGQVALHYADPVGYEQVWGGVGPGERLGNRETAVYGLSHRDIGSQVLDAWNFPPLHVDVARDHGKDDFPSPYRSPVILVSVAGLLASNQDSRRKAPLPLSLLAPQMAHLNQDEAGLGAWAREFATTLETLPLYRECRSLF